MHSLTSSLGEGFVKICVNVVLDVVESMLLWKELETSGRYLFSTGW